MLLFLPLPLELVLHTIHCLLPSGSTSIHHPSSPITKALLSFTLVCHETRRVALKLLRQHCVHLSPGERLRSFLLAIPTCPDLRTTSSLFLAPYNTPTIDDQPTAIWIRELFYFSNTHLRRLVMDMPLRSLIPENDHLDVRHILQAGFASLENLEEFVSVQDDLFLEPEVNGHGFPTWRHWPKLKHLALYQAKTDFIFWWSVARMPMPERLVLTRAVIEIENVKTILFEHADMAARRRLEIKFIGNNKEYNLSAMGAQLTWEEDIYPEEKIEMRGYKWRSEGGCGTSGACRVAVGEWAQLGKLWNINGLKPQH
ncbi:hypothetical protein BCR34DRAFT_597933 [Clohesyomyces aquaticus]|uniref:F-box domain-containing protein n=1 Tax=Clohesyomyces aquaticus TaxID=1231657 RepID=A0A1Y2A0W1_9PLEO|nr:hypothetical protein BCR34DRAFT_597933 [Clohesyomyces aquaticus]